MTSKVPTQEAQHMIYSSMNTHPALCALLNFSTPPAFITSLRDGFLPCHRLQYCSFGLTIAPSVTVPYASSLAPSASSWSLFAHTRSDVWGFIPIPLAPPTGFQLRRLISLGPTARKPVLAHVGFKPDDYHYWLLAALLGDKKFIPRLNELGAGFFSFPFIQRLPHTLYRERRGSGLEISVDLINVIHGTWHGQQGIFLGLAVHHHFETVPASTVTIRVATGGLGDTTIDEYHRDRSGHSPKIVKFNPVKIESGKSTAMSGWELDASFTGVSFKQTTSNGELREAQDSSSFDVSVGMGGIRLAVKKDRAVITRRTIATHLRWDPQIALQARAAESSSEKAGIFEQFNIGLVVTTADKPVLIDVDVEPELRLAKRLAGFIGDSEKRIHPVILDDRVLVGQSIPANLPDAMDEWDDQAWKVLVKDPENL